MIIVARCTTTQSASTAALARWASHSRVSARALMEGLPRAARRRSQLAPQRGQRGRALEARDGRRRSQMLRAALGAGLMGVARVTSGIAGDRCEPRTPVAVTCVIDERPG